MAKNTSRNTHQLHYFLRIQTGVHQRVLFDLMCTIYAHSWDNNTAH